VALLVRLAFARLLAASVLQGAGHAGEAGAEGEALDPLDLLQSGLDLLQFRIGQQTLSAQHASMHARTEDVLAVKTAIDLNAGTESCQALIDTRRKHTATRGGIDHETLSG